MSPSNHNLPPAPRQAKNSPWSLIGVDFLSLGLRTLCIISVRHCFSRSLILLLVLLRCVMRRDDGSICCCQVDAFGEERSLTTSPTLIAVLAPTLALPHTAYSNIG